MKTILVADHIMKELREKEHEAHRGEIISLVENVGLGKNDFEHVTFYFENDQDYRITEISTCPDNSDIESEVHARITSFIIGDTRYIMVS